MTDITFEDLLKEIARKRRTLSYVGIQLIKLEELRDELCPHTLTDEGYLDTDCEEFWTTCACCGKKSEVTRVRGNSYG